MSIQIDDSWKDQLAEEFDKDYFKNIVHFLKVEKQAGKVIYPPGPLIFNAFNTTHFKQVKVVIIGQDPYHGPGQAMGLSFSVPKGVKPPPSLVNIYKELQEDMGIAPSTHGDLTKWAKQGVLLLNASLTVEAGNANSHANIGWHTFTNAVIKKISDELEGVVFILWGNFARQKKELIDTGKHFVLESAHPSPFSVTKFLGNKHFSKTNKILQDQGKKPIDWSLD
jgi:uracil-DNA glycosylase